MYPVAIEEGTAGMWYGRFIDFPGTHARAYERARLLEELRAELTFHVRWLETHAEPVPHIFSPEIEVTEEERGIRELGESGGEVALFQYDICRVSHEELDRILRFMTYNRDDLLSFVSTIPENSLSCQPKGKTRTIIDILNHVCNAEEFYVSRLGKKADMLFENYSGMTEEKRDTLPLLERMDTVRKAALETLRETVMEKGDAIFTRSEYTTYPGEKWTAHKVLRRFLEHEREHQYNIREYLHLPLRGFDNNGIFP
jgi:uncharacterized damage-inducible protein DinB/predicted RNase H-like HicB family nuclease